MSAEIEQLNISINADVKSNSTKIDKLAISLERLQTVLDKGMGRLSGITTQLNGLANLSTLKDGASGINKLANSLTKLQGISFAGFSGKMGALTRGLEPLKNLQVGGIGEFGKGISSLANGMIKLQKIDISALATNINGVVAAIRPLTDEMLRGGNQASAYGQAMLAMAKASNVAGVSANKTAPTVNSLTKSFAKFASITFLMRRAIKLGADMVEQSANWAENLNLFAVSFGKGDYKAALDWTTDLAQKFGFVSNELLKFTGLFKQLGTSLGIASETSTALSKTLTQLALDFSSLYNVDTQRTFETFQSAIFGGQTKGARLLFGVEVAYQSLDQTLDNLSKTYSDLTRVSAKQLTQAQKAELRAIEFLRAGANAQGDMAKTINSTKNQMRVLEGSIANLKLAFGDLLLNEPFQKILTNVNGVLIGITAVVRAFSPLKKEVGNLPENNILSDINDEIDDMNSKLGLLSFDVFNVLDTSTAGVENLAVTAALTAELEKQSKLYDEIFQSQLDKIQNKANDIGKAIKDWFITTDDLGAFVSWTDQSKLLLAGIVALFAPVVIAGLGKLIASILGVGSSISVVNIASKLLVTGGIFLLAYAIIQLVSNWDTLSDKMRVAYIALGVLGTAMIVFSNKTILATVVPAIATFIKSLAVGMVAGIKTAITWLGSLSTATWLSAGAFLAVIGAVAIFTMWDSFDTSTKKTITVVSALIAVLTAAAVAALAMNGALTMGIAVPLIVTAVAAGAVALRGIMDKDVMRFEDGGIVGGNSYTGDKVVARVNSGEMILNDRQQANLFEIANNNRNNGGNQKEDYKQALMEVMPQLIERVVEAVKSSGGGGDIILDGKKVGENARVANGVRSTLRREGKTV